MNKIVITPKKLKGTVEVPSSKSMAHRAIICAALSDGVSRIEHVDYSQDILATIGAMRELGTKIDTFEDSVVVDGRTTFSNKVRHIDCRESGSTLRFTVPVSLVKGIDASFTGSGKLGKRPLDIYYKIFDEQGIEYSYKKDILDLKIKGRLVPGVFKIPGDVSSQFISGLLFSLPLLDGDSRIEITTGLESKAYVDLTLQMLETFGIEIINEDYKKFTVRGNQKYKACDYYVESDFSSAAFWLVADAIGNDITVKGLNLNSLQADKAVILLLENMGCEIVQRDGGIAAVPKDLRRADIDGSQCPDIIPIMSVCAALAKGHTEITNAERLRIKECDRLEATRKELNGMGGKITEKADGLSIDGIDGFCGGEVADWTDHRITMTAAIASTRASGKVIINEPDSVKKSYPNFWRDFANLGGEYIEC